MNMITLESGTYSPPPRCRVGSVLHDEMLGDVKIVRMMKEPIRWPLCEAPTRPGRNPLDEVPVLCGDLVRAVCEETLKTVSETWGVPISMVKRWRAAVAGNKDNVDTLIAIRRHDPEFRRRFYPR